MRVYIKKSDPLFYKIDNFFTEEHCRRIRTGTYYFIRFEQTVEDYGATLGVNIIKYGSENDWNYYVCASENDYLKLLMALSCV